MLSCSMSQNAWRSHWASQSTFWLAPGQSWKEPQTRHEPAISPGFNRGRRVLTGIADNACKPNYKYLLASLDIRTPGSRTAGVSHREHAGVKITVRALCTAPVPTPASAGPGVCDNRRSTLPVNRLPHWGACTRGKPARCVRIGRKSTRHGRVRLRCRGIPARTVDTACRTPGMGSVSPMAVWRLRSRALAARAFLRAGSRRSSSPRFPPTLARRLAIPRASRARSVPSSYRHTGGIGPQMPL
jgi:hypothetical protein